MFSAPQRKKAAGESESDWSGDSDDDADASSDSGDDSDAAARSRKEAVFAKTLKAMMDKRDTAEPGVLQEVRSRYFDDFGVDAGLWIIWRLVVAVGASEPPIRPASK